MNDKKHEIYQSLRSIISEICDFDIETFSMDTVIGDIGLESLDFVEIQVSLMKCYAVRLESEVFISGEVKTIGQLVQYVLEGKSATHRGLEETAEAVDRTA